MSYQVVAIFSYNREIREEIVGSFRTRKKAEEIAQEKTWWWSGICMNNPPWDRGPDRTYLVRQVVSVRLKRLTIRGLNGNDVVLRRTIKPYTWILPVDGGHYEITRISANVWRVTNSWQHPDWSENCSGLRIAVWRAEKHFEFHNPDKASAWRAYGQVNAC